jgi:hypothetical protein
VDGQVSRRPESGGHYESWFVRANHPTRPLAVWVRYTTFRSGDGAVDEGELWATWFDGESDRVVTAYDSLPIDACAFGAVGLDVRIGDACLVSDTAQGAADGLAWDLRFTDSPPLLLFPERFYDAAFPKAKQLTPSPTSRVSGTMTVAGETHGLDDWPGCQSHNWGSKHTDLYAWGQVSGFDDDPDSYLECASAKLKIGVSLPMLTPLVLRLDGEDHLLNQPRSWLRNRGRFDHHEWRVVAGGGDLRVTARFTARPDQIATLAYRNPPGGAKICLNSKLARCELTVERPGTPPRRLTSTHRAAFEILGDPADLAGRGM